MLVLPYLILVNISTMTLEYLYRIKYFTSFSSALVVIIPLSLLIEYGVFNALRNATSYLYAWTLLLCMNYTLRVLMNVFLLKEDFNYGIASGLFLTFIGVFLIGKYS